MLVINRVMLHSVKHYCFILLYAEFWLQDKWSESNFIKWSCSEFLTWYIAYQWHQVHYSLFRLVNCYVKWKVAMLQYFRDFHCLRVNIVFAKNDTDAICHRLYFDLGRGDIFLYSPKEKGKGQVCDLIKMLLDSAWRNNLFHSHSMRHSRLLSPVEFTTAAVNRGYICLSLSSLLESL